MLAARHRRDEPRAAADPEGARPLRSVELVRRDREQVRAERLDVDRNLRRRLHRVAVEERAVLVRDRGKIRYRLNRADLVVRVHHRDDRGRRRDGRRQRCRRDDAAGVDGQQRRRPAALHEGLDRIEHRLVLDARRNNVTATGGLERVGRAAKGKVVGLRAAACEHDVPRLGANQRRHRAACVVEESLGALAEMMDARGVPELIGQGADDGRGYLWSRRGRRVVVEVRTHVEIWKSGSAKICTFSHFNISKLYHFP